jgi:LysM repeat protein
MRKTHLPVIVIVMVICAVFVGGCTLQAAPDVTPTPSDQDQIDQGMAQMATQTALDATATAQAAATPVPTAEPTIAPTSASTEAPTDEPTAEPTEAPTEAPTAEPTAEPTTAPADGGATGEQTYVVQAGDNLYRIALRYGLSYAQLASYNGIVNPNQIYVGQVIRIPGGGSAPQPSPGGSTHVVQPGENLFRIALRYNLSYLYLASYNGITNPNQIYVGQVLRIP